MKTVYNVYQVYPSLGLQPKTYHLQAHATFEGASKFAEEKRQHLAETTYPASRVFCSRLQMESTLMQTSDSGFAHVLITQDKLYD